MIRHDGTLTCRCESCVQDQLKVQGPLHLMSDASLIRYDRTPMHPDNASFLADLRAEAFAGIHR